MDNRWPTGENECCDFKKQRKVDGDGQDDGRGFNII